MPPPDRTELSDSDLIYDWNLVGRDPIPKDRRVDFVDETLRDGLQNPSVLNPPVEDKIALLHLMPSLGIRVADLGLPGSSRRAYDDVLRLGREIRDAALPIRASAAARTLLSDALPIVEISQRLGIEFEAYLFIGSSPIRHYAEAWDIGMLAKRSAEAVDAVVKEGLPVCFVTEDTSRSRPEVLSTLYKVALDHGASRLCVADTVGHVTPHGVQALLTFIQDVLREIGMPRIPIDWHGHNDRGMALANVLRAVRCGVDRVHGTALGIGERVGNASMELILVNLKLMGMLEDQDLSRLVDYCELAAKMVGWEVTPNYPVMGRDAFRTATGVHAAAIIKAQAKGDAWLADRVYSGVPASMVGRRQIIEVGYMSGASNVEAWLRDRGIEPTEEMTSAVLELAKATDRVLTQEELERAVWPYLREGQGSR